MSEVGEKTRVVMTLNRNSENTELVGRHLNVVRTYPEPIKDLSVDQFVAINKMIEDAYLRGWKNGEADKARLIRELLDIDDET